MSSKSHIFCFNEIEAYHECNEPKYSFFNKFAGNNVYFFMNNEIIKNIDIKDSHIKIKLKANPINLFDFSFSCFDIESFHVDIENTYLIITGGSEAAKSIESLKS